MQVKPALKKENLQNGKKKEPKDNRNLYLVKEGGKSHYYVYS